MKRDAALASLSRGHQPALQVALRLRRATPETAAELREELIAYWTEQGQLHFRQEEEILLPAFAAHDDPYHPIVARVLCDHVSIRHIVDHITRHAVSTLPALHHLGCQLSAHIRLEERELFPLIEEAMPAEALAAVAVMLEATDGELTHG